MAQRQVKMSPERYARLMGLLIEGVYNARELATFTGLHYITVLDYCRALHAARLIYIDHWERDHLGRDSIMVYKWGQDMPDKERRVLTSAQQKRRQRERLRHEMEERLEAAGINATVSEVRDNREVVVTVDTPQALTDARQALMDLIRAR